MGVPLGLSLPFSMFVIPGTDLRGLSYRLCTHKLASRSHCHAPSPGQSSSNAHGISAFRRRHSPTTGLQKYPSAHGALSAQVNVSVPGSRGSTHAPMAIAIDTVVKRPLNPILIPCPDAMDARSYSIKSANSARMASSVFPSLPSLRSVWSLRRRELRRIKPSASACRYTSSSSKVAYSRL